MVNGKILVGKCAVWRSPSQAPTDIEAGKCSVSLGGVVCVHVWSSVFFSAMYSFISPSCWQKTLVVPMSRQVWEAVAPPEGALLEDNCVVVSAEGDCNSNMAGRAGPQPVIDLGICQCLDAIAVRSSC